MQNNAIERGQRADLVVLNGNPIHNIQDIRNVQRVFKDGIGYDSARLIADARGSWAYGDSVVATCRAAAQLTRTLPAVGCCTRPVARSAEAI